MPIKARTTKLPDSPGVYFFIDRNRKILYIGKATSLRNRVRSYFASDIGEKRSPLIAKMVCEIKDIKFEKTDSVLEALILEAELIKKHQPIYNTADKDQKSWNYVVITKEDFPRVLVTRERELDSRIQILESSFGPFTNSAQLKEALKIIRKIFPFRDKCEVDQNKPCFNYQLNLCPGTCINAISKQEYAKTIRNIILFFKGRKKALIKNLEKEMKSLAKAREFEKAAIVKSKIFALKHIRDIALIKDSRFQILDSSYRIEAYDIAHISGTNMVGVMVVVEVYPNDEVGRAKKSDYRKFKIRNQKNVDDTRALKEILERRLKHQEWPLPNLIVVDGGVAQMNATQSVIANERLNIPIVSVVKDNKHKVREILSTKSEIRNTIEKYKKEILLANSEAHRFALTFHKQRRHKAFLPYPQ